MDDTEILFNREVGERIASAQKASRLEDDDLAEKAGIRVEDLRAYRIGGRSMRLYRFTKLADALGTDPGHLLGYSS